jgi:hypothetical protein
MEARGGSDPEDLNTTAHGYAGRPFGKKPIAFGVAGVLILSALALGSAIKDDSGCPLDNVPTAAETAVERADGGVADVTASLDSWSKIEAAFAEEFSCSFTELYLTDDQRGFFVYAKPSDDSERDEIITRAEELAAFEFGDAISFVGLRDAAASRYEVEQAIQALKIALPNAVFALADEDAQVANETNRILDPIFVSSDAEGNIEIAIPDRAVGALLPEVTNAVDSVSDRFAGSMKVVVLEDEVAA